MAVNLENEVHWSSFVLGVALGILLTCLVALGPAWISGLASGNAEGRKVALRGDDDDAEEADEHGRNAPEPDSLFQERDGKQHEHDGPHVVEGLGLLRGKQRIGLEEDDIVEKGIEQAEEGRARVFGRGEGP